jgi:hypothetical protein
LVLLYDSAGMHQLPLRLLLVQGRSCIVTEMDTMGEVFRVVGGMALGSGMSAAVIVP